MGTVQRFPAGLLELLAAKTSGWTPGELQSDLQLNLDILQFLGQASIRHETASGTIAEGGSVTLTVPSATWWLLYAVSMEVEKTATATLGMFSLRINPQGSTNWCTVATGGGTDWAWGSTGATQVAACVFVPPVPWILAPGTQLFARCDVLGTDPTIPAGINARVAVLS